MLGREKIQSTVPPTYRRRSILAGLGLGSVAFWGGAASILRQTAFARATDDVALSADLIAPLGLTYVGLTSDPDALIAVVFPADKADRPVAYLCRGAELSIWFTGRLNSDALTLASGSPPEDTPHFVPVPTMSGELDALRIAGEVRLPDQILSFSAVPATGLAGLYVAERDEGGLVTGTSSTGGTLEAQQVAVTTGDGEAPFLIAGTVILADGSQMQISIPARTDAPAVFRWVALADGSVRGAGYRARGRSDLDQAIDENVDL